jgi:predicted nuclease of predicted toxin-antitoxin system
MRLLLDMNLPPAWVAPLMADGHEAMHWRDVGATTASDSENLGFAREHLMVVLTHDLDFGDILAAAGGRSPIVILLRSGGLDFAAMGPVLLKALQVHGQALREGALISLDLQRMRVRWLPLTDGAEEC